MPAFQAMAERANALLNRERIATLDTAKLGAVGPLDDFLQGLGIVRTDQELQYLHGLPEGIKEVLRAAIRSAVGRKQAVTLSWAPAYDWEVTVWDVAGTPQSAGGMTIHLRGPYPQS